MTEIMQKIMKERHDDDNDEQDLAREATENRDRDIESGETVVKTQKTKTATSSKKNTKVQKPIVKEKHGKFKRRNIILIGI